MGNSKKCLITTSLVGAVNWYLESPTTIIKEEKGGDGKLTWKQKAYNDLKDMLDRADRPFPEAAKRGVVFEKQVYKYANKDLWPGSEKFRQVCQEVSGYEFYQKKGIQKQIGPYNCYLYGKYDAISHEIKKIIDLKTTAKYTKDKYLNTFQHKLYCYISGYNIFDYVVVEWLEYPVIKNIHKEHYEVSDRDLLEKEVFTIIEECLDTIKDLGLWENYREKYCLY